MIDLSKGGLEDLVAIQKQDSDLAADLMVRIEAISEDQNVIKNLLSSRYKEEGRLNISLYQKAREYGFYVYRIRFFREAPAEHPGMNDYRIFYFLNPRTQNYIIIAVKQKYKEGNVDHPYDDPEFLQELKERYDASYTR